jgi:ABC transporter substrate binding protein
VRGDGDRVMTDPPSRPEARSRFGPQSANELGASVASSTPEQLPGHEPASARKGYEDGNALFVHRRVIMELAARRRLPAIYPYGFFAREGGLTSYGIVPSDNFRRAAGYVDRILKGEKAGELPVQVPTKFEFVINLKTAKALGLDVPPMLLARADEVIE